MFLIMRFKFLQQEYHYDTFIVFLINQPRPILTLYLPSTKRDQIHQGTNLLSCLHSKKRFAPQDLIPLGTKIFAL